MAAPSTNPFERGCPRQIGRIHRSHTVGGANGTTMVVMFVDCCVSGARYFPYYSYCRNSTGWEFFVPAGTVNSYKGFGRIKKLLPRRIPTVGIVPKVPSTTNTTINKHHHHGGALWPLLRRGIYGSAQSEASNLFKRGWTRACWLGLI
jgi:hypothetical protein